MELEEFIGKDGVGIVFSEDGDVGVIIWIE